MKIQFTKRHKDAAQAVITRASMKKEAAQWGKALMLTGALALLAGPVFAAAAVSSLPWEAPLCKVANSLSGPVANTIGVICVVLTGLALAFGEVSGVFKTMLGVLFGLSVAFLANSWLGLLGRTASCFSTT